MNIVCESPYNTIMGPVSLRNKDKQKPTRIKHNYLLASEVDGKKINNVKLCRFWLFRGRSSSPHKQTLSVTDFIPGETLTTSFGSHLRKYRTTELQFPCQFFHIYKIRIICSM